MEWNRKDNKLHITLQLHICSCILLTTFPYVCILFITFFNFQIYSREVEMCEYLKTSHCYDTTLIVKKFRCKYQEQKYNWSKENNLIFLKIEYVLLTLFCGTIILFIILPDRIQQNS
jgi:hypothetical protein